MLRFIVPRFEDIADALPKTEATMRIADGSDEQGGHRHHLGPRAAGVVPTKD